MLGRTEVQVAMLLLLTMAIVSAAAKAEVNRGIFLTVPEQISQFGYPVETHTVQTEDGYILNLHRIPYGKKSPAGPNRPPVLVQHGILATSGVWVIPDPEHGYGFILADAGFDVWLGNARGNSYSNKHVSLDRRNKSFWKFSWHEMGVYDLPAIIDYILGVTNQKKLYYVGHSMGTTMFYAMASLKPEYNDKIRVHISMAPVVYMQNVSIKDEVLMLSDTVQLAANKLGMVQVMTPPMVNFFRSSCLLTTDMKKACTHVLLKLTGSESGDFNETMLPHIFAHTAGTSANTVVHYTQNLRNGKFRQFDYGSEGNVKVYGVDTPPAYPLGKVSAPVELVYSFGDAFVSQEDITRLAQELPNICGHFKVSMEVFNHLDFLWGSHAKELVYDHTISVMKRH